MTVECFMRISVIIFTLLLNGLAYAQDENCPEDAIYGTHMDCHFNDSASRKALIDDRGGQGEGVGG